MTKVNAQSAAGLKTSEKIFVSELEMGAPIMPMRASNLKFTVMIGGALASQLMNNQFLGMECGGVPCKGSDAIPPKNNFNNDKGMIKLWLSGKRF